MQNQAVSNINLHMNFYQMGNKVLPMKANTLTGEGNKAGKMTRQRSEKIFAKDAALKKHASKKSVARASVASKSNQFKVVRQNETLQERTIKLDGTGRRNAQSKSKHNVQDPSGNKWDNIHKLMRRLKSKLEPDEPDNVKVFKNIEKILKHVKNKKKKAAAIQVPANHMASVVVEDKNARLTTLHIEPQKKDAKALTSDNLADKYKFLEYLDARSSVQQPREARKTLDIEDKQQFLTRTFELVATNNYFFLPKRENADDMPVSIQELQNLSPNKNIQPKYQISRASNYTKPAKKTEGDRLPFAMNCSPVPNRNFKSLHSFDSKRSGRPVKHVPKQDMEVWATSSRHSFEILNNDLALKMSRSQIDEHLNRSLHNKSLMLQVARKRDIGGSVRKYDSITNNSRVAEISEKIEARSLVDVESNLHQLDREVGLETRSVVKMLHEKQLDGPRMIQKNISALLGSFNDLEPFDDIMKPSVQDLDMILHNHDGKTDPQNGENKEKSNNMPYAVIADNALQCQQDIIHSPNDIIYELTVDTVIDILLEDLLADAIYNKCITNSLQVVEIKNDADSSSTPIIAVPELFTDADMISSQLCKQQINNGLELQNSQQLGQNLKSDSTLLDAIRITDDNLDDLREERSVMDRSDETVYAVRTHFNAISEYLYILCDYLSSNESWSPSSLLHADLLSKDNNKLELASCLADAHCFNRSYYQAMSKMVVDSQQCERLYEAVESEIQMHCGLLANMQELVRIQRTFHRAIFDCFVYCFARTIVGNLVQTRSLLVIPELDIATLISEESVKKWIDGTREKVLEICGFLCGIIRDKEDSMMADMKFVNDATLNSLHEDRMMRMLVCDALMYSKAWNDASLVKLDIVIGTAGDVERLLFNDLIDDFVN